MCLRFLLNQNCYKKSEQLHSHMCKDMGKHCIVDSVHSVCSAKDQTHTTVQHEASENYDWGKADRYRGGRKMTCGKENGNRYIRYNEDGCGDGFFPSEKQLP